MFLSYSYCILGFSALGSSKREPCTETAALEQGQWFVPLATAAYTLLSSPKKT